ncbi:MAG: hypothetical protein PHN44_01230 [Candidatus Marinimicrobia bacterium]|nr:hypothetical protein [Candidatus Neomarinimicrobiota bacterium]MDD5539083.1 hypothetical protein [Candidatus Neomarinimicrobiota bacterium]
MNYASYITSAQNKAIIMFLNNFPRSSEDRDIADEAIARFKKYADGEYLVNILPDARPEWVAARNLIIEQYR